jgi:hypothetical protein
VSVALSTEVETYLSGVRGALADLPPGTREELLEDLAEHLAEVAAEGEGSLVARLGEPAAYAAELRAAAGITRGSSRASLDATAAVQHLRRWARAADLRLGRLTGYERFSDFGRLLRPAWWVLRGYVLALILMNFFIPNATGVLPPSSESFWPWLAVVGVCALVSVRIGAVSRRWRHRTSVTLLLLGANVALALFLVGGAFVYSDKTMFVEPSASYEDPYGSTVVFPYDDQGRPLTGVRLVDQYGQPVRLGTGSACANRYQFDVTMSDPAFAYPLCGQAHPLPSLPPLLAPTAAPTASSSPETGVLPTVSPTR